MAKIKLKIIKFFLRVRKYLVVFGLVLSFCFFSLGISVFADFLKPNVDWFFTSSLVVNSSQQVVADCSIDFYEDSSDTGNFYVVTAFPISGSLSSGVYEWQNVISLPVGMNKLYSFFVRPSEYASGYLNGVGRVAFSSDGVSWVNGDFSIVHTSRGEKITTKSPDNQFFSYMAISFQYVLTSSSNEEWTFWFNMNVDPYSPVSASEQDNFPSPDSGTVDEFDEMESGLADDSADQFEQGYSWLMGFQRFLDNTWTLQALSGITKFINYLTGQESMNGHIYSDWDYFMKPLFFALAIGILPFILGIPLRFLRSGSSKK